VKVRKRKPSKKKVLEECRQLVEAGTWIAAIKVYRNGTGCGLFEAVEAIRKMRGEVSNGHQS